jgi:probable phosphoglycerate mutase
LFGWEIVLDLAGETKFSFVKDLIHAQFGFSISLQRIIYAGLHPEDERSLSDYNIRAGSKLFLLLRPRSRPASLSVASSTHHQVVDHVAASTAAAAPQAASSSLPALSWPPDASSSQSSSPVMLRRLRVLLVRHGETEFNVARRLQGQMDIALNDHGRAQARCVADFIAAGGPTTASSHVLNARSIVGVFSSDLARASETASIIMYGAGVLLPLVLDAGLRERGIGHIEGKTLAELRRDSPYDAQVRLVPCTRRFKQVHLLVSPNNAHSLRVALISIQRLCDPQLAPDWSPAGGGESARAFHTRCIDALYRVCRQALADLVDAPRAPESDRGSDELPAIVVVTHGGVLSCIRRHVEKRAIGERKSDDSSLLNASLHWLTFVADSGELTADAWNDVRHLRGASLDDV